MTRGTFRDWVAGAILVSLSVATGACGSVPPDEPRSFDDGGVQDAEFPAIIRLTRAAVGPGVLVLQPNGYPGPLCVGGVACTSNGQAYEFDLPAGRYNLNASATWGLARQDGVLGELTVEASGAVYVDASAAPHFGLTVPEGANRVAVPSDATGTKKLLTANTSPVQVQRRGYGGLRILHS